MKWEKKISFAQKAGIIGILYSALLIFFFILIGINLLKLTGEIITLVILFFAPISIPLFTLGIFLTGMHNSLGLAGYITFAVLALFLGWIEGYVVGKLILIVRSTIKRFRKRKK